MPPANIRQRAISLIEQLPQNKLEAIVQLLAVLAESTAQSITNAAEAHLLAIIQRHLPEIEQTRLNELRDRFPPMPPVPGQVASGYILPNSGLVKD